MCFHLGRVTLRYSNHRLHSPSLKWQKGGHVDHEHALAGACQAATKQSVQKNRLVDYENLNNGIIVSRLRRHKKW